MGALSMTFLLTALAWLKKVPGWAYGALGIALAIGWAFLRGKSAGRAVARQKEQERTLGQAQDRKEIEDEIRGTDPKRNRDELREWVPGAGRRD